MNERSQTIERLSQAVFNLAQTSQISDDRKVQETIKLLLAEIQKQIKAG